MQATIDIIKFRGIFFTTWTVECGIQFAEVESIVIRQRRLAEKTVHYVGKGDSQRSMTFD